jgi:hypothetical protein
MDHMRLGGSVCGGRDVSRGPITYPYTWNDGREGPDSKPAGNRHAPGDRPTRTGAAGGARRPRQPGRHAGRRPTREAGGEGGGGEGLWRRGEKSGGGVPPTESSLRHQDPNFHYIQARRIEPSWKDTTA